MSFFDRTNISRFGTAALMACLVLGVGGCSVFGGGGDGDNNVEEMDEDEIEDMNRDQARAAWPKHTGPAGQVVSVAKYNSVTLIPFADLVEDAEKEGAGYEFVEEVRDRLEDDYSGAFNEIRIETEPLGLADELVVRGQVYDFSYGGVAPFVGRISPRFETDFSFNDGATGEVLKSGELEEKGEPSNHEMLRKAAQDMARLLGRGAKR